MKKFKSSKKVVSMFLCAVMLMMVAMPINVYAESTSVIDLHGSFNDTVYTYGKNVFTFDNGEHVILDINIPNINGADWVQGTVTLTGTDGTSISKKFANFTTEDRSFTWYNLKSNVKYQFFYELHAMGTSHTGYIVAEARQ